MNIQFVLSVIAIALTILNALLAIGKSYSKMLLFLSLTIALIWCIYGYFDKKPHIFYGYLIIFIIIIIIILMQ